jgi:hypothetical protein
MITFRRETFQLLLRLSSHLLLLQMRVSHKKNQPGKPNRISVQANIRRILEECALEWSADETTRILADSVNTRRIG